MRSNNIIYALLLVQTQVGSVFGALRGARQLVENGPSEDCEGCVLAGGEWCLEITGEGWCGPIGTLRCDGGSPPPVRDANTCGDFGVTDPYDGESEDCEGCVMSGHEWCKELTGVGFCGPIGTLLCDINTPPPVRDANTCNFATSEPSAFPPPSPSSTPSLEPSLAPISMESEPLESCIECVQTGREWCSEITGIGWCGPVGSLWCDAGSPDPVRGVASCPPQ